MEDVRSEKDKHVKQAQPGQGGQKGGPQDKDKGKGQGGQGQPRPGQGDQTRR
jgi:hypothetical protein